MKLYIFKQPSEVSHFLESYPFLVPLLYDAYEQISYCFRTYVQLVLEVVTDPEAVDDQELVAFIRTDLPPGDALSLLDKLDNEWWLEASVEAEGKLCIHVEFL